MFVLLTGFGPGVVFLAGERELRVENKGYTLVFEGRIDKIPFGRYGGRVLLEFVGGTWVALGWGWGTNIRKYRVRQSACKGLYCIIFDIWCKVA